MNIIGDFLGTSGYSIHTRELANALNKLTDVSLQSNLHPGWERQVNDAELQMIKRESDYEVNLIITNPLFWRINCNAKMNIVYLVWEGDSVPQWIIEECMNDNIHKIICPSEHTKQALLNTVNGRMFDRIGDELFKPKFLDKVVTIPHGVNLENYYPIVNQNRTNTFKFLMNKGFTNMEDRGGVQYGVKAYLEEFTNKDNVELIVKINPAYGIPDLDNMFKLKKNSPKIRFITENLSTKQLNELYNECDVFLSPTRAEAFNLPCLESLACGKPVITTNYGGQTDFCDGITGLLIDYKLVEIKHDIFYEGIKWATPNIESLRAALRSAYGNHNSMKKLGKQGLSIAKNLTWDNTAKQINTLCEKHTFK